MVESCITIISQGKTGTVFRQTEHIRTGSFPNRCGIIVEIRYTQGTGRALGHTIHTHRIRVAGYTLKGKKFVR
ncbi:MAG: hypothetical protein IJY00_00300, partial [Bacteroidaceae bacterium]|nr:hypothetical protein [Bacteroidaceae bacterium]